MNLEWSRLNLLSGVLFVILVTVGFGLVGLPGTDDADSVVRHFATHRERILIGGYLVCLGLVALIAWGWAWRDILEGQPSHVGLAVLFATALTAGVEFPVPGFVMSLAYISDQAVDPQLARALAASAQVFSYVDYFPTLLLFVTLGWAILASKVIHQWFGASAFLLALVSLVIAYPPLNADLVGAGLDALWIIAASIALFLSAAARRVPRLT